MPTASAQPVEYRGHVANGVVVFDGSASLPEGTAVRVEPLKSRSLADRFRNVIGCVKDLPKDLADNHDHYIHGAQRK